MSGIIGSKLNIRGSGLVGSVGTDGQHLLSSGAGKTNAFETAAAGSDVAARQDIATLALKLAIQENAEKHNLTNSAIVQFQADGDFNLAGSTNVVRNASEYISSAVATSQTLIAYGDGTSVGFASGTSFTNLAALRDGDTSKNKADCYTRTGTGGELAMGVDWGSGTEKTITGFETFAPQDDGIHEHNQANGRFRITGSATTITPSASNGTLLSQTTNVMGSATDTYKVTFVNTTAYRYNYLWIKEDAQSGTPMYMAEWKLYEGVTGVAVSATGTALGTTNVPSSAVTKVSGVLLLKNAEGTATLGTDVKVYFTADNSAFTEASSYADAGTFSTGIKMIRLGETTVTSGSDVRWKIVWANQADGSKESEVHGIGINY